MTWEQNIINRLLFWRQPCTIQRYKFEAANNEAKNETCLKPVPWAKEKKSIKNMDIKVLKCAF